MEEGLIDLADVEYVSESKLIEEMFKKYRWVDSKRYLRVRLREIFASLDKSYDLELAKEKQALYFINAVHKRFF